MEIPEKIQEILKKTTAATDEEILVVKDWIRPWGSHGELRTNPLVIEWILLNPQIIEVVKISDGWKRVQKRDGGWRLAHPNEVTNEIRRRE